jgi:hypothetical protein
MYELELYIVLSIDRIIIEQDDNHKLESCSVFDSVMKPASVSPAPSVTSSPAPPEPNVLPMLSSSSSSESTLSRPPLPTGMPPPPPADRFGGISNRPMGKGRDPRRDDDDAPRDEDEDWW